METQTMPDGIRARSGRTERLLTQVPVWVACIMGLALGATRFVAVLRDNLRAPVANWDAALLLVVIMASVVTLIVIASAAAGLCFGLLLRGGLALARRSAAYFSRRAAMGSMRTARRAGM